MEKVESKKVNRKKTAVVAVIVAVILILGVSSLVLLSKSTKKSEPSIITTSTLEKILNVSDLSTFEAIYNGVAKVVSPDDPQKIDYYVSYDATVKAGIDFEHVEISVDDETKIISVKLPEIKITDITVDIESMDYIFINDNTGKTLVVYYSASGNTERVAKDIAEAAGADLFEIVPTEVYTSDDLDWTNPDSRVSREHDDESLRDVPLTTTEVPDWDSYDTVFIGYPIWWGIAAWPVDTFVKNNDFTGKTVIPFATSTSSGMGQSGSLLADMAGTGEWQEGQRFSSGVSSDDVQSWVNGLGL